MCRQTSWYCLPIERHNQGGEVNERDQDQTTNMETAHTLDPIAARDGDLLCDSHTWR